MRTSSLEAMVKGWFVGDFQPAVFQTDAVEVGIKHYRAGDAEPWHTHRIATEITVVISGEIEMGGRRFKAGDIVVMEPGEGTDFRAITDVVSAVVKVPGAKDDKYVRDTEC